VTPILREMVNMFSAERCLFGSNFPVDKPWVSYGDMIAAYRQAAAGYNQVRRSAIFHDTAARIYRL
jgi:predicted TIM-barrel fold metal-dependent hydrolase